MTSAITAPHGKAVEKALEDFATALRNTTLDGRRYMIEEIRMVFSDDQRERDEEAATAFRVGDTVSFKGKRGITSTGTITRINRTTAFVDEPNGPKWRVHLYALTKTSGPSVKRGKKGGKS